MAPEINNQACRAALVYDEGFLSYDFGPYHPLRPERIVASFDLLAESGLWHRAADTFQVSPATDDVLALVHDDKYIDAVREAGSGNAAHIDLSLFGLGHSDNPAFPNMHDAAALVTGGSLQAMQRILDGELCHAFAPAGGLHHAIRGKASGFCIYNDPAVAAAAAVQEYDARVLYVDFDCHHGDGVQWLFYNDPRVMTVSFHESGEYLFPGTGDVTELGIGPGEGYSINVPFAPYSRDSSWKEALHVVVPTLVERFKPDLIISSHGADTHVWDPLTHLALTTSSFVDQAALMHRLAHEHCDGRWLAVGSGGYDWCRVVPRAWSIVWTEMTGRQLPRNLSSGWRLRWAQHAPGSMPHEYIDPPALDSPGPYSEQVSEFNRHTLRRLADMVGLPDRNG